MNFTNPFSLLGLILDLFGAIFLGSAFFFTKFKEVEDQSRAVLGVNGSVFNGLTIQTVNGRIGTIALILGFLQQFIGSLLQNFQFDFLWFIYLLIFDFIIICSLLMYKEITIESFRKQLSH